MADLTPEQMQLFWDVKEMFPNVSGEAIKANIGKGHQELSDMILDNQLPFGDEYIGDSKFEDEEIAVPVVVQERIVSPGRVVPVGLMRLPPQPSQPAVAATISPPASSPVSIPVKPKRRKSTDMGKNAEEKKMEKCTVCSKNKLRVGRCHCVDEEPDEEEENKDTAAHIVCGDCLKTRYMRNSLETTADQNAIFCLVKECSRVLCREVLLSTVEKTAMVEWMLGANVSLREASVRQSDRERKRQKEEEVALTETDCDRYEYLLTMVDEEKFVHITNLLPDISFSWILEHFDYGEIYLVENQAVAVKRMKKRRDKKGITHLVEARLKIQTTFTCTVCFEEYRTHLAISCIDRSEAGDRETHSFCAECVQGHAKSAVEQNVIVQSGIGIKCMQPKCDNVLMRAHIDQVLDSATLDALDPFFANEALIAANVQAEKCQRCAYAAIIEIPAEEQPVFSCRRDECRYKYCRQCGRTWDEKHEGKNCDELDPEQMQRRVAERLTEMMMHRCPRCQKPFVKIDGCNKITCPCGKLSCYICKQEVAGYDHFSDRRTDGGKSEKCQLWDDPTAREKEAAAAELEREIAAAGGDDVAEALKKLK